MEHLTDPKHWTDHHLLHEIKSSSLTCYRPCVHALHTRRSQTKRSSHPSLFSLLLYAHVATLLVLLTSPLPALASVPPRCLQPHPAPNCEDHFFYGQYYYYNASFPHSCLRFYHWGCEGENKFMSQAECVQTCEGESSTSNPTTAEPTASPTLSPMEVCQLPIVNFFCVRFRMTEMWDYNWETQLCESLHYFNCKAVPPNMVSTEEECIALCGAFSSHYNITPHQGTVTPSPTTEHTNDTTTTVAVETTITVPKSSKKTSDPSAETPPTSIDLPPTPTPKISPPSSQSLPPSNTPSDSTENPTTATFPLPPDGLTTFDLASIAVGVVVVLLVVVLALVLGSLLHRHKRSMRRRKISTSVVAKLPSHPLSKQTRTVPQAKEKIHLYPTTSHYV